MSKPIITLLLMLLSFFANAQEAEMADTFREDGKIYIVIAVIGIIFISIIAVLIFIERKLKKIETELKDK